MAIPTGSFRSESAVEEGWKILQFLMQRASEMRGSPLEKNERQSLEGRYALGCSGADFGGHPYFGRICHQVKYNSNF